MSAVATPKDTEASCSISHSHAAASRAQMLVFPADVVAPDLIGCLLVKNHQLTITYPEGDAQQLHQALQLLKRSRCLNVSAFCRAAIAEKLERLEQQEAFK